MSKGELAEHLSGRLSLADAGRLRRWFKNENFKKFVQDNKEKIRRKLDNAKTAEDKADVLCELEIANSLLLVSLFALVYEPHGGSGRRRPDFLVSASGVQDFSVEVKRIRESAAAGSFSRFQRAIVEAVHEVPSTLGVSLDIIDLNATAELATRLCDVTHSVIDQCVEAIQALESRLMAEEFVAIPVRGFEEEVRFTVEKIAGKSPASPTAYLGGVSPVPYTQKESFKFTDLLCDCLGQLRPGLANVLAVRIHSCSHESQDFNEALHELGKRARAQDDEFFQKKGFLGAEDFLIQAKALSAVLIKSDWSPLSSDAEFNVVWRNRGAAILLKDQIVSLLKSI
jgi:hypothetical protein